MPTLAPRQWVGSLLLVLAVPLLLWQSMPEQQWMVAQADFLALHSTLEILAIVVAALVFFTGAAVAETGRSSRAMELGGAFLAVGVLDLLHLLAYAGMPDLVGANSPQKTMLLWLLARYIAAFGLLGYVLLSERPAPASRWLRMGWFAGMLLLALGLAWLRQAPAGRWLLVQEAALPDCVDRGLARDMGNANRRTWWLLQAPAAARCDGRAATATPATTPADDDADE